MGFSTTDLAKLRKLYDCGGGTEVCRDDYGDLCVTYSQRGGCVTYREFMAKHCAKRCGFCKQTVGGGCIDKDSRYDLEY